MWIRHIPFNKATGRLKQLYDRVAGPDGNVDNIMLAHSARPHSMEGHMALYKNVLHHGSNTVPKWFLECIGVLGQRAEPVRLLRRTPLRGHAQAAPG